MSDLGFVKFYRKMLNDPILCKDTEYWTIWCYLLLSATHKEIRAYFKGEEIILKPRTTYYW